MSYPLIYERSRKGRRGLRLVKAVPRAEDYIPKDFLRESPPRLPEVDELTLVRHYTGLSRRQVGVDTTFYPLGSCTMKYNPKLHEEAARLFAHLHPYQDSRTVQGALRLMWELGEYLKALTGMEAITLQPAAGAHGELTGILIIRAYHEDRGEGKTRRVVLVPDSAHGSNPATASMAGYQVKEVPSGPDGEVDLEALKRELSPHVAAIMLTNPNTLGLFERRILEISCLAKEAGVQLYYDGANLNAIMGWARPGDMGFDVVHLNLHKTFTVPHGGGGPGSGPVGVKAHLAPYLPVPTVERGEEGFYLAFDRPKSIGRVRSFQGNFLAMVRAWAYIRTLGLEGLKKAAALSVLNARYLKELLKEKGYRIPYDGPSMHEFVAQPPQGYRALDLAKGLLELGFHPPTVYFPLIVKEALMVEPTETESKETLEAFAEAMGELLAKPKEWLENAPFTTPVRRLDELRANKTPKLTYFDEG